MRQQAVRGFEYLHGPGPATLPSAHDVDMRSQAPGDSNPRPALVAQGGEALAKATRSLSEDSFLETKPATQ